MNTVMVWMLISVSSWTHNYGTTTVVGHFTTQKMCEHVQKNLPNKETVKSVCIQAEIVR